MNQQHTLDRPFAEPIDTAVVDFPVTSSWRRRFRRIRARPFSDPLGLGVMTLLVALTAAVAAAWLLTGEKQDLAAPAIALSVLTAGFYSALAARAFKRDKAVQYWRERRKLESELNREAAHRAVLLATLNQIQRLDSDEVHGGRITHEALGDLVSKIYRALAARHDDVAVILALQSDRRCQILHSELSPGSRWKELQAGKQCHLGNSFREKLSELSRYHRSFEVPTESGLLRVAILHDSPLSELEVQLLQSVPSYFAMIAHRWRLSEPIAVEPVRSVS